MCIWMYICVHISVCLCVCICVHTHVCVNAYVCMYICVFISICVPTNACMCIYAYFLEAFLYYGRDLMFVEFFFLLTPFELHIWGSKADPFSPVLWGSIQGDVTLWLWRPSTHSHRQMSSLPSLGPGTPSRQKAGKDLTWPLNGMIWALEYAGQEEHTIQAMRPGRCRTLVDSATREVDTGWALEPSRSRPAWQSSKTPF